MVNALDFTNDKVIGSHDKDKTLLWVTAFDYGDNRLGISVNELTSGKTPGFIPPTLEMGEAVGAPVSYASAECGNENIIAKRVYMASNDGGMTWKKTGSCPLSEGSFCNIGFPDGRIIGLDVGRINEDRTGWCDYISVRESRDGGNSFKEIKRLLKGCSVYLWRVRRLSDNSIIVLASLYGTPWGPGKTRPTRNTELPGETYINKIQTFFLHSRDGVNYTGPHYILPGTGAHEYDVAELSDGRLLFVAGDVQATPVSRQFVTVTESGFINGPLLPIRSGAPKNPSEDPQGGYVPETFISLFGDVLIGARRNKTYSYSTDYGENWFPVEGLPVSLYQPYMILSSSGRILNFGHFGGDVSVGMADTYVGCHGFTMPKDLPAPAHLSIKRMLNDDNSKYLNKFEAKLKDTNGSMAGKTVVFRILPYWKEDGSVNTLPQSEAPIIINAITDSNGLACVKIPEYDEIRDIHFAYKIDCITKIGDTEVHSPLMTVLAMTPERENTNPYEAYFAEGTLFLSPAFLTNNPDSIKTIENNIGKTHPDLPMELKNALIKAKVLNETKEGLSWIKAIHSNGLSGVASQGKGDYYV